MKALPLIFCLTMTGCAAMADAFKYTPASVPVRPQVFVAGATRKQVTDALVNRAMSIGLQVNVISDYSASFKQQMSGLAYDTGVAEEVVTYDIAESSAGVRLTCTIEIVEFFGTAHASASDVTERYRDVCDGALAAVKGR